MFLMSLSNLFKRYERWNPVHPTYGAFWGLGIGVGCGVGWGPGFGPEVIGYVGSGCGIGFSVGVTFVGFGVGLPASGIISMPYNAVSAAACGVTQFVKHNAFVAIAQIPTVTQLDTIPRMPQHGKGTNKPSGFAPVSLLNLNRDVVDAEHILEAQLGNLNNLVFQNISKSIQRPFGRFRGFLSHTQQMHDKEGRKGTEVR
eukprot:TRINITY_DN17738_c0_g1_i2.p1 TRINITY_DN17738_c0_g1~~TRINITY_DN17738_c0_g1_i2.p1  ORF type:complete len:200 (+),score=49.63 TRINITY_DN17738_c0_g1_i2:126-725(+)